MSLAGNTLTIAIALVAKDQISATLDAVKGKLGGLDEVGKRLAAIGAGLAGAGLATSGMSASAQNLLAGLAKSAATVDDLKAKLRSMPDVTGATADQFERRARDWAKKHADSVESYMETIYQMVSAGLTAPEEALQATETAMRVAKGTMGDAISTANGIAVAFNNMADKAKPATDEIARLGDVLTKTQQMFQISNMAQLGEGMKYAFPAAKAARMEFTELATVIGQLNTAGLQGSQAGTAFAASIRQLVGAQDKLGFQIQRNKDGTLDFIGTLEAVTSQFGDFTKLTDQDARRLQKAFGDEGSRAVVLLGQNLDGLKSAYQGVADSAGAAAAAQAEIEAGQGQRWEVMANKLRDIGLSFGDRLLPILEKIEPKITGLLDSISDFVSKHPDGVAAALGLLGLAAVASPLLTAAGAMTTMAAGIVMIAANPAALAILSGVAVALGKIAAVAAVGYGAWKFGEVIAGQIDIIVQKLTDNKSLSLGEWLYDNEQEGKERAERWKNNILATLDEIQQQGIDRRERWLKAGSDLVAALRQGITDGLKGALGIGQKLTEALAHLKNEGAKWAQVGRDIMQGLLNGIQVK